eukprot:g38024.t1
MTPIERVGRQHSFDFSLSAGHWWNPTACLSRGLFPPSRFLDITFLPYTTIPILTSSDLILSSPGICYSSHSDPLVPLVPFSPLNHHIAFLCISLSPLPLWSLILVTLVFLLSLTHFPLLLLLILFPLLLFPYTCPSWTPLVPCPLPTSSILPIIPLPLWSLIIVPLVLLLSLTHFPLAAILCPLVTRFLSPLYSSCPRVPALGPDPPRLRSSRTA